MEGCVSSSESYTDSSSDSIATGRALLDRSKLKNQTRKEAHWSFRLGVVRQWISSSPFVK